MPLTLRLQPSMRAIVELALARRGWSWSDLTYAEVSRVTIQRFRSGNPIRPEVFKRICDVLGLDVEQIANLDIDDLFKNTPGIDKISLEESSNNIELRAKENADLLVSLFQNIKKKLPPSVPNEVIAQLTIKAFENANIDSG